MKGVLLDSATLGDNLDFSALENLDISMAIFDTTSPEQVAERIRDAEIILTNKVVLHETDLSLAKQCKYIGVLATGMNNVPVSWCHQQGITVQNVENYGTDTVAQHTLALLLALASQIPGYVSDVKQGKWASSPHFCMLSRPVTALAGRKAVIVGHGTLGQRVEQLFIALGMEVHIAARPGNVNDKRSPLTALLPEADVISLHCQLSDDTRHMINADTLKLMKPSAFLINTARGDLINEEALLDALNSNQLGGAALDVLSQEPPPPDHILLVNPPDNLLVTPHSAWTSLAARQRLLDIALTHISDFLATAK